MDRTPQVPPVIKPIPNNINSPLWSVMIPAYNCSQFLTEALESVLIQDPGPELMQIEVIDDRSTDDCVSSLVQDVGKGRIQYFQQPENVGSLRNFETCLNRSRGKWLHLLHGDDRIEFGFYKEIEDLFTKFPEAGAAFTHHAQLNNKTIFENPNDKLMDQMGIIKDFLSTIAVRQRLQPPAIVVKRAVYESLGGFFGVHFGEDWEMWTRIASRYPVAHSPKCLALYRIARQASISHQSFITGQNIIDLKKVIEIVQQYLPPEDRKAIKYLALKYNSVYCMRVANSLLAHNKKAAFRQAEGAFKMHFSFQTLYLLIRFYLMSLLRYKEIEKFILRN